MRVRRAMLYTPGDEWNKINKAISLNVDSICMDLEDGTAASRKVAARATIIKALDELKFGRSEKLVRINPVGSGLEEEELNEILPHRPDGIVIPKIENIGQIESISSRIGTFEQENGLPNGQIRLLVVVESAIGLLNLREIAAHPRLDCVIFGAEDFTANIGAKRTNTGWEVLFARSTVVTCAAAFEKQAMDMVSINFRDPVTLKIESAAGASLGFTGKQIIHPSQAQPVQEAFTPSDKELEEAAALIKAFRENEANGAGAFEYEGKMIDLPILKQAEKMIERGLAAGKTFP